MAEAKTEERKLEPKAETEEIGPCKLKVRIEISREKVQERIDEKYRDLNNSVALPGFRKGHAPRNLLERKFGKAILDDLKGELLADSFEEVREEKKLEPVGEPDIDAEKLALREGEDAGEIFHPLRWQPQEAWQLLRDVPQLESAGVVVRMPATSEP